MQEACSLSKDLFDLCSLISDEFPGHGQSVTQTPTVVQLFLLSRLTEDCQQTRRNYLLCGAIGLPGLGGLML